MRTTLGAIVLLTVGCVTNRVGPGVLREDWNQPRRDPDPTRNPTEEPRGNPWSEERAERVPPPGEEPPPSEPSGEPDTRTVDLAKRGAATFLAWAAAGWLPLVEWSGTFEEDPHQRRKHVKKEH